MKRPVDIVQFEMMEQTTIRYELRKERDGNYLVAMDFHMQAEFEDTKGVIRICISKKNRQHNGQKKKYKRTNNDLQNIHIKLKNE
jgi:ribosomal protein S6